MRLSLLILLGTIILMSCEDKVSLNFERTDKRLVVEGTITDQYEAYYINLSYPAKYTYLPDNAGNERQVTEAIVSVEDDLGNVYNFPEQSPGLYASDPSEFQGMAGRSYTLHISTADGEDYISYPETMMSVAPIDDLYYEIEGEQYKLYIDMQDPEETGNYYQWRIRYNGQYVDAINIAPDEYFNGNYLSRFVIDDGDYADAKESLVIVDQYSITRERYKFLYLMDEQVNNGGTPFDAPASPIVGNVYKEGDPDSYTLGYFAVSSISSKSVTID